MVSMQVLNSILEAIGNTPVLRLKNIAPNVELYGKYEAGNPSFSIKDRIALSLIEQGERDGKIKADTVIVNATAGNTGVALAMVCAVKKLKLVLFMPKDASLERRKMFEGFGAELKLTPSEEGIAGTLQRVEEFIKKNPKAYLINQFENPETVSAHRRTTAKEILADFPAGVDALVLGVGTGGSITAVGEELRKVNPSVKVIAVEPTGSAVLSGGKPGKHHIQQIGYGFVPKNLNRSLIDEVVTVSDSEAHAMTKQLSLKEGLLVGISTGANVHAALQVGEKLGQGKKVLTFLCDAGQRYFSLEKI
jgi:cysteine synthase